MKLISPQLETQIQSEIIQNFVLQQPDQAVAAADHILEALYAAIPAKKRISYGRYSVLKDFAKYLHPKLRDENLSGLDIGAVTLETSDQNSVQGLGLALLSYHGLKNYVEILPHFEAAAQSDDWILREHAQGLFRKVVKAHSAAIKPYLLTLVQGEDPNLRRFVSESLRPVVENRWLHQNFEYSLSILRYLFREPHPYPRTSVGNNLSDIARRDPELIYELVAELVEIDDKNAYWIAYRACRNLVKTDPLRVMDLLRVDEYKYKHRRHHRRDIPPRTPPP